MEKFTMEYAEKLARENVIYGESIFNYSFGYMKALEEVAAPDMLDALIEVNKLISIDSVSNDLYNKVNNAINKATK